MDSTLDVEISGTELLWLPTLAESSSWLWELEQLAASWRRIIMLYWNVPDKNALNNKANIQMHNVTTCIKIKQFPLQSVYCHNLGTILSEDVSIQI